jgi:ubiquinone/menaquinone biosynthesis C-methylase UbiE
MLFDGSTTHEEFCSLGESFLSYFLINHARIGPNDRILDIGCGLGQKARPLTRFLSSSGSYSGLDIVTEAIDWCREHYSAFPNFEFSVADVFNREYNPDGKVLAKNLVLPYPDESFDCVVLASVFTHLIPDDVEHYFHEIARVTRRGARTISTYFLFNDEARSHIRSGRTHLPFRRVRRLRKQVYRVLDPDVPEKAVAYEEDWVRALHLRNRLSIVEITYGNWCGRTDLVQCLQDTIIAMKE